MTGPRETKVRASLSSRPAGIIQGASREAQWCFAGLFNGARGTGWLTPNGNLSIGKAECEWNWKDTWAELCRLQLLQWGTHTKYAPGSVDLMITVVTPAITDKGLDVRSDDLAYHRELMAALDADEKEAAT